MIVSLTKPEVLTPADFLDEAADVIEKRGWCQGREEGFTGEVCSVGALNIVMRNHPELENVGVFNEAAHLLAKRVIGKETSYPTATIISWNDGKLFINKKKVVKTFRKTANKARKEQGVI